MTGQQIQEDKGKPKIARLLKKAAAKAIKDGDPWQKHHMERIPAERVIRHLYNPEKETWYTDETIVKIEKEPFTHGAMRHCFRMKKRSPPPQSASNHRFHDFGWNTASNYIAKAYLDKDGNIDTSEEGKKNVMTDILLQYEAQLWAEKFNDHDPPKKIVFIRAYAIEFPDRNGNPWFAVERFISGFDDYGVGFQKHNTNSGFVDEELHRVTPQCFSAFSFYQSKGNRLVADIQGVGDLWTDPQVLSSDYRFGDGDLGPRGMSLFFHSFRHNSLADALGIPVFPLSHHELKHQAKYEEDDLFSMSGDISGDRSREGDASGIFDESCRFAMLDMNRSRRQNLLSVPPKEIDPDRTDTDTEKRSNMSTRDSIRMSLSKSFKISKPTFKRTKSEVNEVEQVLALAKEDFHFTMKQFHRKESGELKTKTNRPEMKRTPSLLIRKVSDPIEVCDDTRSNLGRVHYQLSVLHGLNRFPESVPDDEDAPHDAFSILFHLCHAASLHNVPACLALGRLHAGLGSCVSPLVAALVPINFDDAKDFLKRAIDSEGTPSAPRLAAAFLLYQICLDDNRAPTFDEGDETQEDDVPPPSQHASVPDPVLIDLLQTILDLIDKSETEAEEARQHKKKAISASPSRTFQVGDRVFANYFLEGTYYTAVVDEVSDDGSDITVMYDDDGSKETLNSDNVRPIIPPTATQTNLGGPLSDEEALGMENSDEKVVIEVFQLRSELAELVAKAGDNEKAAALYEEASSEAMEAGRMKIATELSLKAAELAS
mmetsp:Transcript_56364/g.136730  ORF Transcript_56364/g.136730 Transcript_56364/m.136730 type:complete len:769 (+) Transcript_56364:50-2356(+)